MDSKQKKSVTSRSSFMISTAWILFLFTPFLGGCKVTKSFESDQNSTNNRWTIVEGGSSRTVSIAEMADDLANDDVVFLGETHLDHQTHLLELDVIQRLHEIHQEKGRSVIVSLEMLGRNVQGILDAYLAGEISESEFMNTVKPWNNYKTGYRPIVEWAKENQVKVIAANVPSEIWRKVAFGGGLSGLSDEERSMIAEDLLPSTVRYWQRYDRTVRGHGHASSAGSPEERVEKVQSLWDNTMAESVFEALQSSEGSVVIHVNGGFHSMERDGTVHQLLLRDPEIEVGTVHIVPTFDLATVVGEEVDPVADWVVWTAATARGDHSGSLAIYSPRPLRYLIDAPIPEQGQSLPALIWLGSSESDPAEELKRLREIHGPSPIIVVVEQTYSAGKGGEWLAEDHRIEDLSTLGFGLSQLRDHLLLQRNIQADHWVLAGAAQGAEVVVSISAGDPDWPRVWIAPGSGPGWFGMEGLSDPPDEPHSGPGIRVVTTEEHRSRWEMELKSRAQVGTPMEVRVEAVEDQVESRMHHLMGKELDLGPQAKNFRAKNPNTPITKAPIEIQPNQRSMNSFTFSP
ncbi:MAG: hypothetical protein GWP35_01260 [Proteobacteria bacterium]|nr:hypothetical protein [Pseudomonadota bacterium]